MMVKGNYRGTHMEKTDGRRCMNRIISHKIAHCIIVFFFIVLATVCVTQQVEVAAAYTPSFAGEPHWDHMPVYVYVEEGSTAQYNPSYKQAVMAGAQAWGGATGNMTQFAFVESPGEADIIVKFVSTIPLRSDKLGYCEFEFQDEIITGATITLAMTQDGRRFNSIGMQNIAKHEFGHALGLDHSVSTDDLMNPKIPNWDTQLQDPSADNIETLRYLYAGVGNTSEGYVPSPSGKYMFGLSIHDMKSLLNTVLTIFAILGIIIGVKYQMELYKVTKINHEIPEVLGALGERIDSGLVLESAMREVSNEHKGIIASEFENMLQDSQDGYAFMDVINASKQRIKSSKFSMVMYLVGLSRQSGGSISNVLKRVARFTEAINNLNEERIAQMGSPSLVILTAAVFVAPLTLGTVLGFAGGGGIVAFQLRLFIMGIAIIGTWIAGVLRDNELVFLAFSPLSALIGNYLYDLAIKYFIDMISIS